MKINNKLFILAYIEDNMGVKLLYGEDSIPNIEICHNKIIYTAEIVGIRENIPIIIFSEYKRICSFRYYEEKRYGIIINSNIIELEY